MCRRFHYKSNNFFTQQAESVMQRENINWEWQTNGDLSLWNVADAVKKHPTTNEEIFFNQATASHCSYYQTMPMVFYCFINLHFSFGK